MRRIAVAIALLMIGFPIAISAQESSAGKTPLNEQQILGRRLFRQRCAVCHYPPTPGARIYGPTLYKELIDGNEDAMRGFIMSGSKGRMPGFKYGLDPAEIDAIVEFLKTVPKPQPTKSNNSEGPVD